MLSVVIITKNEALALRRCLESVSFADEIIVLDSGSTDATQEIALEFTSHVYESINWLGYGIQKQRALALASGAWVLNLDADECVNAALQAEIKAHIAANTFDAFRMPIRMCFYGQTLRYSSSPSRHIRLFKRNGAHYSDDIVHEKIVLSQNARVGKIKNPILHTSYRDVSHAIEKMNRYSSYSARVYAEKKGKTSMLMAVVSAMWMFGRCYLLQRGFLDGKNGLLLAVIQAQASFYRKVKQLYPDLSS